MFRTIPNQLSRNISTFGNLPAGSVFVHGEALTQTGLGQHVETPTGHEEPLHSTQSHLITIPTALSMVIISCFFPISDIRFALRFISLAILRLGDGPV